MTEEAQGDDLAVRTGALPGHTDHTFRTRVGCVVVAVASLESGSLAEDSANFGHGTVTG